MGEGREGRGGKGWRMEEEEEAVELWLVTDV